MKGKIVFFEGEKKFGFAEEPIPKVEIKSSSFPAFLKENQPDVPSVSSYGMKINIPTTIII